ncbi:hypothetical protein GALMADRAFT_223463 [Galerina marginata CBS 339.88]|uniref:Fungal-type protein kinase domain-containing protein n=1 Tax=Galerina marginata (strain CBS 339.88) TaxID=685588 RepID=A0A067TH27_GALM3|nr:hypothetical protein GALMADRAFT_223463 [Galerina marginata CBS 339.88]
MSIAEPISTPSKNATSAMNRSGKMNYQQEAIKGELEADINNSAKCSFDAFLKHFLSLVLRNGSKQKKRLDELQTEIEELQSQRYYKNLAGNGGLNVETAAADVTENTEMGDQGFARNEDPDDDTRFGSEKEKELVKERDFILDELLRNALDAVLPIANDLKVKEKLKAFAKAFLEKEPSRYGPYVLLCNDVLKRLATIGKNLEVRKPDPLNIRFRRSDPKSIISQFAGMKNIVDRKPDVIITSLAAALHADGLKEENKEAEEIFSEKPEEKFEWEAILSSGEFKVSTSGAGRIPEGGKSVHLDKPFENGSPRKMLSHASLANLDHEDIRVAKTMPGTAEGSGSKRARESEHVGEHSSPTKKQRKLGPESASGSKLNSVQESAADRNSRMQANIIPKNTQEAINGRVQCASYALEMMSYSAGVHHAINLLFTDDYIWIWYYDRQGILQSDGLSIFWNFPRFLVLLFALQRFTLEDWGVIRCLNPKAVHRLEKKKTRKGKAEPTIPEVNLDLQQDLSGMWVRDDQNNNMTSIEVNMKEFLSHQPHCLAGRATSVVGAKGYTEDGSSVPTPMVCKIYHPELQRRHEGLTLQVVR